MHFTERIAIVDGLRSPFVKSWSTLNGIDPVALSTHVTRELLFSVGLDIEKVDQIVWGTVVSVPSSPNIAREVALNLGLYNTPGFTISRACASGFQSIASAAESLWMGHASIAVAGGVDVTSNAPVPHKKEVIDKLRALPKASTGSKLSTIAGLRPSDFFPVPPAITERFTGKTMGEHAEDMAKYFGISREEQEQFAIDSHKKAHKATSEGWIAKQISPIMNGKRVVATDNIIRPEMNPEKLKKMRPAFDKVAGSITAATSSALTDGASAVLLMRESTAKELGLKPKGFLKSYAFPAIDPRENMLLGNVYSTPIALDRAGLTLEDLDLIEIHEAFAAQVLSNLKCFADDAFFQEKLGREKALGEVDMSKLNIWGSSLAYGHPFAATGGRMIMTLLQALEHTDGRYGLATACAAGGLGAAMIVERA
jgi:acetyl-CoA acyltransferase